MPPSTLCQNCNNTHATPSTQPQPTSIPSCFFITIRRSGRDRLPLSTPHTSIPLSPTNTTQSHQLRDYIWSEFSNLKAEVDLDRDSLTAHRSPKSKGQLKEKAPIPWLSWSSPGGQSGQTRNRENFCGLWEKVMGEASAMGVGRVWVSSVLLPVVREGELGLQELLDRSSELEGQGEVFDVAGVVRHERQYGPMRQRGGSSSSESEGEYVPLPIGAGRHGGGDRRPECLYA